MVGATGAAPRLLLVDDSAEFLESARFAIREAVGFEVVGSVRSAREALEQIPVVRPDIVFVDVSMPRMNGFELTRRIKALAFPPAVVILTLHDEPEYREAAALVGADGFLAKGSWHGQLERLLASLGGWCGESERQYRWDRG